MAISQYVYSLSVLSIVKSTVGLALGLLVQRGSFKSVLSWRDIQGHNWHIVHSISEVICDLWSEDLRFLAAISSAIMITQALIWRPAEEVLRLVCLWDLRPRVVGRDR